MTPLSRTQVRLDLIEDIRALRTTVEGLRQHFDIFYQMSESTLRSIETKLNALLLEAQKL